MEEDREAKRVAKQLRRGEARQINECWMELLDRAESRGDKLKTLAKQER